MEYEFGLVGVSPVLSFFNTQQNLQAKSHQGAEYLGAYHCTLDAFIESVGTVPRYRNWNLDRVVDSVINFWLNNAEQVRHWKEQLEAAGTENLLIARVADLDALRSEFESLFGHNS
jgi:hypothetical protein